MLVIHLLLQKAWLLMSGIVFLAKGAKVMLTMNLWVLLVFAMGQPEQSEILPMKLIISHQSYQ